MRIISNSDIRPHIGIEEVMAAYETVLEEYYRGEAARRPRIDMWSPTSRPNEFFQWGTMEGVSQQYGVFATRLKSDVAYFEEEPDGTKTQEKYNTRPGLYCGIILVFSIENGAPIALIHDGHLQHLRVGAKAGLAAREGALDDASVVGILGSGGMARSHLRAFDRVRDIERVHVYSPTAENRELYAREMAEELGIRIETVGSPQEAVENAQIIACCTDANEPVLHGEWIPEGAFITTVKSTTELDREAWEHIDRLINFSADPDGMRDRQLPLDTTPPHSHTGKFESYAAGRSEDYRGMPEASQDESHPQYEQPLVSFADLINGEKTVRMEDTEIISYGGPSSGQGIQFAAVAGVASQIADEHDLGRIIPNEWILETERN